MVVRETCATLVARAGSAGSDSRTVTGESRLDVQLRRRELGVYP